MKKINPKAQSMLEYALLIITVAAAFMAMNVYVRRAVNARLHDIELEINPPIVIQEESPENPLPIEVRPP